MASLIFNSYFADVNLNNVKPSVDTFYVVLLTSSATPDKDTWLKRSDVTNEVVGTGYTAGGNSVTVTDTKDLTNDRQDVVLGGTTWPASTLTARYAVYYKHRGGASSADELVAVIDFGSNVSTTAGTFTLTASTLRIQN